MLSLQKYRARPGLTAVSALVLAAAAAVLLVLLPERWERILVAAVTFLAGAALALLLARRARTRERARIEELETAEARHRALLDGLPLVTWLTAPGDRAETLYVSPVDRGGDGLLPFGVGRAARPAPSPPAPGRPRARRARARAREHRRSRSARSSTACSRGTAVPSGCARTPPRCGTRKASRSTSRPSCATWES